MFGSGCVQGAAVDLRSCECHSLTRVLGVTQTERMAWLLRLAVQLFRCGWWSRETLLTMSWLESRPHPVP